MNLLPINELKQISGDPLNWKKLLNWVQLPGERFESIAIIDADEDVFDRIPSRPVKCLTFDGDYYIAIPIEDYNNLFNLDIESPVRLSYEYSGDLDNGCNCYDLTPEAVDDEFVYCTMDDLDKTDIDNDIFNFISFYKNCSGCTERSSLLSSILKKVFF